MSREVFYHIHWIIWYINIHLTYFHEVSCLTVAIESVYLSQSTLSLSHSLPPSLSHSVSLSISISLSLSLYIYIYIYIEIERERKRICNVHMHLIKKKITNHLLLRVKNKNITQITFLLQ